MTQSKTDSSSAPPSESQSTALAPSLIPSDREGRIARLNELAREGRLTRREWRGRRGYKAAQVWSDYEIPENPGTPVESMIAAMVPEMESHRDFDNFPEDLMPTWFAHLTMWMEDYGRDTRWLQMTATYTGMMKRSAILTASDWARIRFRLLRLPIRELRLISRMDILEHALHTLDVTIQKGGLPEIVRVEMLQNLDREIEQRGWQDAAILERAKGVFAPESDTHIRSVFHNAAKMLPPKDKRRRPGVASRLTDAILRTINREIDIQQRAYAQPAIDGPADQKALPATKQKALAPSSAKRKARA